MRRTEGKDGEDELDSVAETIRTGTVLDGFGRAVTYREETVQNNNPASWMSRVVDRMSYNVDGNLTASHEATLNSLGWWGSDADGDAVRPAEPAVGIPYGAGVER